MKWFDTWIQRAYNRARSRDEDEPIMLSEGPRRGHGKRLNAVPGNTRVEHNYDDESVITFKVYGANGGMIVETARYDDKRDHEAIRRYVISEDADLADSLGKIVSMEYLR